MRHSAFTLAMVQDGTGAEHTGKQPWNPPCHVGFTEMQNVRGMKTERFPYSSQRNVLE